MWVHFVEYKQSWRSNLLMSLKRDLNAGEGRSLVFTPYAGELVGEQREKCSCGNGGKAVGETGCIL